MGFNTIWRKWIRECLASSSVSVLINGSPTNQFPVSKGIRQGDPLSPFLFLIVAEGLNGLVSSAVEKQLYKGVAVGNEGVSVSHLQFADDTIFFGEASEDNIGVIKSIMRTFELVSGLKINFGKSQLMGIGVEDNWRNKMAFKLCCKEGEFPFKYLGIPIGGNHKRVAMWQPMVDSFKKKLTTWKGQFLSLGGRITLINSVLSSLPVFLMSVYLIPKGVVEASNYREVWREGGTLAGLIKEKEGLGSTWWRDVCCIDKMDRERVGWLLEGFRIKLGDGKRNEEAKELQQLIEDKRIKQGRPDSWEWVHDKDGQYSTKTAYSILTKDQIETNEISTYKRIWNPKFPSKVSAFNWQLLLDRIPTKVNLVIRGIIGESKDGKCVFCKEEDEDSKHLFLKCKITSWVWQECAKWWGTEIRLERDCWNSFQRFGKWSKDPKGDVKIKQRYSEVRHESSVDTFTYQSDSEENEGWSTESEREKHGSVFAEEFAQVNGSCLQEEDDDVAGWQRREMEKPREQATSGKGKQCNTEENSLEHIQNLKEVEFRVGAEEARLLQGDVAVSKRLGVVEGEYLGLCEQSEPKEDSTKLGLGVKSRRTEGSSQLGLSEQNPTETGGKLNPQAENTDFEESINLGWTQTQKGKESKSRSTIDGFSRNKEVEQNSMDIAEGDPFWNGFEEEQRGIEEWIKKQREEGSTKKKRRIKMCRSVYAKSRAVGMGPKLKKGRRKQCKQDAEGRSEPSFLPRSKGKIAGDSVGDSGIQNCNRCLKKQMKNNLAVEIWDLAKKLGAVAEDDREIIQRIEEMESRDSRDKAEKATHGSGEARKVCLDPDDFVVL
ncbi:hypothetical protein SLEP1_g42813 [Rubroshorea leprosula]|uniref:Reverse transcriptase domain-containing protein n=1 Tax=Rubroshorea leprosula TaxID=152421 RepID=A0AAV5LB20_9ROSI|nr:hypothetical protein SLEP1_g42813 [Rubroshorea leprosula]